jgi:hypothetical protein
MLTHYLFAKEQLLRLFALPSQTTQGRSASSRRSATNAKACSAPAAEIGKRRDQLSMRASTPIGRGRLRSGGVLLTEESGRSVTVTASRSPSRYSTEPWNT